MFASFHSEGTIPSSSDKLNTFANNNNNNKDFFGANILGKSELSGATKPKD